MGRPSRLVLETQRHLKWRSLDHLEALTMALCGLCLAGFSTSVFLDVLTRTLAAPWLWLQEVTSTFFVYGIFIGAAAATRRNDPPPPLSFGDHPPICSENRGLRQWLTGQSEARTI